MIRYKRTLISSVKHHRKRPNMAGHDEQAIEKEINEKGLNAPRLKPEDIVAAIVDEKYHVFEGTTLTVVCLILRNGFTVTGESAAASADNFDEVIGRKIAREKARNKIWMLEGYLLRDRLYQRELTDAEQKTSDS